MGRLDGKVALITGAGGGIGRTMAVLFAGEGAKVIVADAAEPAGQATVDEIDQAGGDAAFVRVDVSKAADAEEMVRFAVDTYGELTVLCNNAGIFPDEDGAVVDMDEATFQRVMDVNVKGVFLCCKYGIPELIKAGGGSVINIASFVALMGCTVPQDAYTSSKGAVISLTRSLAVQYGRHGIRANAICPGPIETPLMAQLLREPAERNKRLNRIPLGRFGRAEDIVYAALYLASDESSWTTGTTFIVDGGICVNYF